MPSSKIKPPSQYPAHWHQCLLWLTTQPEGKECEIEILDAYDQYLSHKCSAETWMRKLATVRQSFSEYPMGWSDAVVRMSDRGELRFERRGSKVFALRRPNATSFLAKSAFFTKVMTKND